MAIEVWQCRATTQLSAIPGGLTMGSNYLDNPMIINGEYDSSGNIVTSSSKTYVMFGGTSDVYWASNGYYGARRVILLEETTGNLRSLINSYGTKVAATTEDIIDIMKAHLKQAYSQLSYKNATMPTNKNLENLSSTISTILTRKTEQTKSTTITTNGTTTVTPDSGKVLSSVSITTNVTPKLQTKTVTPSKERQDVTPDSSYNGLSKVTVNAIPDSYSAIVDVATAAEMNAKLTEANVGSVFRFTGTTDDTYTNGDLYEVVQEGGGGSSMNGYTVTLNLDNPSNTFYYNASYAINGGDFVDIGTNAQTPIVLNNVKSIQFGYSLLPNDVPDPGTFDIGTTVGGTDIASLSNNESSTVINITADTTYYLTHGGMPSIAPEITDLTNTTWAFPGEKPTGFAPQKSVDGSLFYVDVTAGDGDSGTSVQFNTDMTYMVFGAGGFWNTVSMTYGGSNTITITGGTDVKNETLIEWLTTYAELQEG